MTNRCIATCQYVDNDRSHIRIVPDIGCSLVVFHQPDGRVEVMISDPDDEEGFRIALKGAAAHETIKTEMIQVGALRALDVFYLVADNAAH